MPVEDKEEYNALRQEMLEGFERIHDITKYGVLAFVAFLSFYYSQPHFDDAVALLIFQLLTLWIALITLRNFEGIFTQGTYIRLVHEKGSEMRWHKMSRDYDRYYEEYMRKKGRKSWWVGWPYPIGRRWGGLTVVYAYATIFLTVSGLLTVLSRAGFERFLLYAIQDFVRTVLQSLFHTLLVGLSIFLCFINLWISYKLIFKMRRFREETEEIWKAYLNELVVKSKNTLL